MKRHALKLSLFVLAGAIIIIVIGATLTFIATRRVSETYRKLDWVAHSETTVMTVAIRAYVETGSFTPAFSAQLLEAKSGWAPLPFTANNSWTKPPQGNRGVVMAETTSIIIARRLGDFVFTCHGADPLAANPNLWFVICCLDPRVNRSAWPTGTVTVGLGDGTIHQFSANSLRVELRAQNEIRAAHGLAPLPDPRQVLDIATVEVEER